MISQIWKNSDLIFITKVAHKTVVALKQCVLISDFISFTIFIMFTHETWRCSRSNKDQSQKTAMEDRIEKHRAFTSYSIVTQYGPWWTICSNCSTLSSPMNLEKSHLSAVWSCNIFQLSHKLRCTLISNTRNTYVYCTESVLFRTTITYIVNQHHFRFHPL